MTGDQSWPDIALGPTEGYIVWQDNAIDHQRSGIGGQRLSNTLTPIGEPFRVNYTAAGSQERPSIALLPNGGAVVAWQNSTSGVQQICARFINPDGTFLTRDIQLGERSSVATKTWTARRWIWVQNKLQRKTLELRRTIRRVCEANQNPRVVALADGGAVVIYSGARKTVTNMTDWIPQFTRRNGRYITNSILQTVTTRADNLHDIVMQRLSPAGVKLGAEVTINQFTDSNQRSPAAVLLPDGNVLVVWVSEQEFAQPLSASLEPILSNFGVAGSPNIGRILGENRVVISARVVTPDGVGVSDEFRVDGDGTRICATPDLNLLPDGRVTIAWTQRDSSAMNAWDIYTRTFGADFTPLAEPARLNTYQRGDQAAPKLATLGENQFAVWTSMGQDGSREGVFGRLLASGVATGDELRVNTTTPFSQRQPVVAAVSGEFVAVWSSFAGVAAGMELMGQRFTSTSAPSTTSTSTNSMSGEQAGTDSTGTSPPPPSGSAAGGSAAASLRLSLQGSAEKLTLSWNTITGGVYQIQTSTDLKSWADLGAERVATGNTESFRFQSAPSATFYRVKRVR